MRKQTDSKITSLDKYTGEWVALADGKVVAHGRTLRRLMEKVKKIEKRKGGVACGGRVLPVAGCPQDRRAPAGQTPPSVLLVPKEREGVYII